MSSFSDSRNDIGVTETELRPTLVKPSTVNHNDKDNSSARTESNASAPWNNKVYAFDESTSNSPSTSLVSKEQSHSAPRNRIYSGHQSVDQQRRDEPTLSSTTVSIDTLGANNSRSAGKILKRECADLSSTDSQHSEYNRDKNEKPPYSYATLIKYAIETSPSQRLLLSEIYDWIIEHYPFYATAGTGWKNSIRHNLSLNKSFVRTPRPVDEPGKGSYWTISSQAAESEAAAKLNRSSTAVPSSSTTAMSHRGSRNTGRMRRSSTVSSSSSSVCRAAHRLGNIDLSAFNRRSTCSANRHKAPASPPKELYSSRTTDGFNSMGRPPNVVSFSPASSSSSSYMHMNKISQPQQTPHVNIFHANYRHDAGPIPCLPNTPISLYNPAVPTSHCSGAVGIPEASGPTNNNATVLSTEATTDNHKYYYPPGANTILSTPYGRSYSPQPQLSSIYRPYSQECHLYPSNPSNTYFGAQEATNAATRGVAAHNVGHHYQPSTSPLEAQYHCFQSTSPYGSNKMHFERSVTSSYQKFNRQLYDYHQRLQDDCNNTREDAEHRSVQDIDPNKASSIGTTAAATSYLYSRGGSRGDGSPATLVSQSTPVLERQQRFDDNTSKTTTNSTTSSGTTIQSPQLLTKTEKETDKNAKPSNSTQRKKKPSRRFSSTLPYTPSNKNARDCETHMVDNDSDSEKKEDENDNDETDDDTSGTYCPNEKLVNHSTSTIHSVMRKQLRNSNSYRRRNAHIDSDFAPPSPQPTGAIHKGGKTTRRYSRRPYSATFIKSEPNVEDL